jgi:glycosyltransferase involved in cell wall biosynthesis
MDRGGAETMIMSYYRNIDRSRIQFDFVVHTHEKCAFDDEIESLGGNIYRFPRYNLKNHFQYVKLWKDLLKGHPEYKIIHGHYFTISAIYFAVAGKFNTIRIGHSHIYYKRKDIKALKVRLLTLPVRYFTDYYFACTKLAGEWLYGKKFLRNKELIVQNNSIDAKIFSYSENSRKRMRAELNVEGKFVIGNVGRFSYQKNHGFLIDIFKSVHEKNSNSVLLLVGKGELQKGIEEKVAHLGLKENVIFTGVRSDIPDLMNAMDLLLLPSHYEGFAIVLLEAQAAGLKCLASADVVPNDANVTNLLEFFPLTQTADQWADKILQASTGYERRSRYNELVSSGYDIISSARWLQNFYMNAAGKKEFKETKEGVLNEVS